MWNDALNGCFALQMTDPKGEMAVIISLQVNTLELYMNYSSLDGFTNLHVGQVTAESFFCEVTTSASNSKSCYVNNLPFRRKEYSSQQTCLIAVTVLLEAEKIFPGHSPKGFNEREIKNETAMNMVKVFIKGQEDKELSSFLRYYPTRIKNVGIDGVFDRQTIFDFKDGCNQPQVAQFVAKELVRKFGRKIGKVVFSCVPASSQERNETRNKAFSALVCQLSGAIDGFSHVKVNGERSAVHGTKMKKEVRAKRLEESNTIEVDASFFKNKIVCVWDDVVTTGTSFCAYAAQLESVGAHVTNGIFLGKTSYRYVPTY